MEIMDRDDDDNADADAAAAATSLGLTVGITYGKTDTVTLTDVVGVSVQAVVDGGETNLHAHPGTDGIWFVLAGRARFYDDVK